MPWDRRGTSALMPAMRTRALVAVLVFAAACGGSSSHPATDAPATTDGTADGADVAPVFRNPVTLADDELATQALQILGADIPGAQTASCNSCHGMSNAGLKRWGTLSAVAMTSCLTDLSVATQASAQQMIACIRTMPEDPASDFATPKLGVYASAGRLPWFEYLFKKAYGAACTADQLTAFQEGAAMPRGTVTPFTQAQFDIVAECVRARPAAARRRHHRRRRRRRAPPASPATRVATHVAAQKTTGWRAVNADNLMAMYDCGASTDPRQCLQDKALASTTTFGTQWDTTARPRARAERRHLSLVLLDAQLARRPLRRARHRGHLRLQHPRPPARRDRQRVERAVRPGLLPRRQGLDVPGRDHLAAQQHLPGVGAHLAHRHHRDARHDDGDRVLARDLGRPLPERRPGARRRRLLRHRRPVHRRQRRPRRDARRPRGDVRQPRLPSNFTPMVSSTARSSCRRRRRRSRRRTRATG